MSHTWAHFLSGEEMGYLMLLLYSQSSPIHRRTMASDQYHKDKCFGPLPCSNAKVDSWEAHRLPSSTADPRRQDSSCYSLHDQDLLYFTPQARRNMMDALRFFWSRDLLNSFWAQCCSWSLWAPCPCSFEALSWVMIAPRWESTPGRSMWLHLPDTQVSHQVSH